MRFLLSLLMLAAIAWSGALVWFVNAMPTDSVPPSEKAEAIIVLTGGKNRVEHGFEMLADGAAPILLISGVGEHVSKSQMLIEHTGPKTREKIDEVGGEVFFDRISRTTVSNADQSAAFIKQRGIHSIRLVTASYHMKRSVHEFRVASPDIEIIPDPVFPDDFRRDQWWQHDNTRRLVFSEFYKYLAVLVRDAVRPA